MNTVRKLWENSNINGLLPGIADRVRFDEPMAAHTSFRVGGPADLFACPASHEELAALVDFFSAAGVSVSILGGGSNLLVSDKGIRGAVVSLEALDGIAPAHPASGGAEGPVLVRAGAGATMDALTRWCAERELSGLERFAGLPGTVGGAVFMNARCYEISVSDVFFSAETLYFRGGRCTIEERQYDCAEWGYKKSPFQERTGPDALVVAEGARIILSAVFSVVPGERAGIMRQMDSYREDRERKGHFRFPSAGSMFKNNHAFGKPSGKIIDEAGLRGFRIGDAQVAPWHGNIVINTGHARASDLRALVDEVRRRVREQTGFDLEPEVIMAGDW